ncbi:MAG: CinA family nicotinamide mononucleotide deamidase-related protein [Thermoanaerobaculaceae bacterium]
MREFSRAAFLAVGTELLRTDRLDTNSLFVARQLLRRGVELVEKRAVPDDEAIIARAVEELLHSVELVVVSGGLGPTADDVTRQGVARALGRPIREDAKILAALRSRYQRLGRDVPQIAVRMAQIIEGSEVLPNPRGTAPGLWLQEGDRAVVLLPGVPEELEGIFLSQVIPKLPGPARLVRTLRVAGRFESEVEQRIQPLYQQFGRKNVTILAGRGTVDLVLFAPNELELAKMERAFAELLKEDIYGQDEQSLAEAVLSACRRKGWLLATAESCTGGLIGAMLTSVPGASQNYLGGVVAYANSLKAGLLDVDEALLARVGAVSRETAEAMAEGARRLGAHCGLAVTGIAGPAGGTPEKPVGTVHMAVVTPLARAHRHQRFLGSRQTVREMAANFALDLLRRLLLEG